MKSKRKLTQLVNDVEELLAELGTQQGPEIKELRDRIGKTIDLTKAAILAQGDKAPARIGRYVNSMDGYVNDYPRLAFATGVLIAGTVGYLAGVTAGDRR
jgi:ElaB/YqjD/DUF883 family membrane-anchored ribosome-binding protein